MLLNKKWIRMNTNFQSLSTNGDVKIISSTTGRMKVMKDATSVTDEDLTSISRKTVSADV